MLWKRLRLAGLTTLYAMIVIVVLILYGAGRSMQEQVGPSLVGFRAGLLVVGIISFVPVMLGLFLWLGYYVYYERPVRYRPLLNCLGAALIGMVVSEAWIWCDELRFKAEVDKFRHLSPKTASYSRMRAWPNDGIVLLWSEKYGFGATD